MNRMKKEAKRKYDEARVGLSDQEIAALDREDLKKEKIERLAQKIHGEKFPEEWDFMGDSILDASKRSKGINPMSEEYIAKVNKRRENLGVSPFSCQGMRLSSDTWELCLAEAKEKINNESL